MANALDFEVTHEHGAAAIMPRIDGVRLTDMVAAFERAQGYDDPAGGYGGLVPERFRFGPLDRYFLGASAEPYFAANPAQVYLLGCECGEAGCWPLTGTIAQQDGEIRWSGFRQPHRPARDYSAFGPFVFARAQYEQAVRDLAAANNAAP